MARLDTGELLDTIRTWIDDSEHLTDDDVLNNIKELMNKEWGFTVSWQKKDEESK
jgi:hypothetical protein